MGDKKEIEEEKINFFFQNTIIYLFDFNTVFFKLYF